MKVTLSPRVVEALEDVPSSVKKAFYKQIRLLVGDLRHPSLRAKKFDDAQDFWQARVNRSWRFYFKVVATPIESWISFLTRNNRDPIDTTLGLSTIKRLPEFS